MKKNQKIVVTGAAGLVGQNLVPLLVSKGYSVVALDKNEHNLALLQRLNPSVHALCVDFNYPGKWIEQFKDVFCVIQMHAQIAAPEKKPFVENNITATRHVLEACQQNKIKNLIHLSSSVVISVAKDDYTETKRAGEEMVHASKTPHTILRPPLLYGCFDAKHLGWITAFMQRFPLVPVPSTGTYVRQPLFVEDLCGVILSLITTKPKNEIINIIGHEKIPYVNMLRTIANVRGWRRVFVQIPLPVFGFMLQVYRLLLGKTVFTPDQMKALVAGDEFPVDNWPKRFGVRYTPFSEGMQKTWNSPASCYASEMVSPH